MNLVFVGLLFMIACVLITSKYMTVIACGLSEMIITGDCEAFSPLGNFNAFWVTLLPFPFRDLTNCTIDCEMIHFIGWAEAAVLSVLLLAFLAQRRSEPQKRPEAKQSQKERSKVE